MVKKYRAPDKSRLAALCFNPQLSDADKHYISSRLERLHFYRSISEGLGFLVPVGYIVKNKFKMSPMMFSLFAVPWLTGVVVNFVGYLRTDRHFDSIGLYDRYGVQHY